MPRGMSGDHGITMEENTPFGVVGGITPVTHSIPTLSCNIISMVAAGNSVVFNAHPGGAEKSRFIGHPLVRWGNTDKVQACPP